MGGLFLLGLFLPAVPLAATGPKLDAKLQRLDGSRTKLSAERSGPVLLELWATWCLPCREQNRILEALRAEFERRGVDVLALHMGGSPDVVAEHLEKEPSAWPVLVDRLQTVSTRLGISELPALVLVDGDGRVVGTARGLTRERQVLDLLDALRP